MELPRPDYGELKQEFVSEILMKVKIDHMDYEDGCKRLNEAMASAERVFETVFKALEKRDNI